MHFKKIGEPMVLPIIEGYHNLSDAQKESVFEQGYSSEDFPIAKWEIFFELNGLMFSDTMDLQPVGSFNVLQGFFSYFFAAYEKHYGANLVYTDGVRNSVHIQEIEET
jgi:hypothetical protein